MLDGGLSTELERRGADLDHQLWSSVILLRTPQLISEVHTAYLDAGADIIATATYQASKEGLRKAGLSSEASDSTMREAVSLALDARDRFWETRTHSDRLKPLVAASLGPYGACLHDGSEYHGRYDLGLHELIAFHRPRVQTLIDCGADLFAFETIPSLLEGQAIIALMEEFPEVFAWLSFSCRNSHEVAHGEPFALCAAMADESEQIIAVGANCTAPEYIPGLLESARDTQTPLAVYPNSGESWDATRQQWCGQASDRMDAAAWRAKGARLIGGCCRTGADDITRMKCQLMAVDSKDF